MLKQKNGINYKFFNFQSEYSWLRLANGFYFVDPEFEQEFIKTVVLSPNIKIDCSAGRRRSRQGKAGGITHTSVLTPKPES